MSDREARMIGRVTETEVVNGRSVRVAVIVHADRLDFGAHDKLAGVPWLKWEQGERPFHAEVDAPDGRTWSYPGVVREELLREAGSWATARRIIALDAVHSMNRALEAGGP